VTTGQPDAAHDRPPRISLVVVNYNSADYTRALLAGIGPGVDEVVVVDNHSPDGSPRDLDRIWPGVDLILAESNLGYGAGANLGARRATGEVIVVANPDVMIRSDDLRALGAAATVPGVALVAPRFVTAEGALIRSAHRRDPGLLATIQELSPLVATVIKRADPEWHATLLRASDHDHAREVAHVLGALIAVRTSAFWAVGGFDERFFLYREETDLCLRLRQAGWQVRHEPVATAIHWGEGSTADTGPIQARAAALESHYRFIEYRWGVGRRRFAWVLGAASSASWAVLGKDRRSGCRALRWHFGANRRLGPG
jgi:N-acetylglucosaminyl-diphospho-decaprenol L-rhamnosyltransferase